MSDTTISLLTIDTSGTLDLRPAMEFNVWYRLLNASYCSKCGPESKKRKDLMEMKVPHKRFTAGYLYALCPDHMSRSTKRIAA